MSGLEAASPTPLPTVADARALQRRARALLTAVRDVDEREAYAASRLERAYERLLERVAGVGRIINITCAQRPELEMLQDQI